MSRWYKAGTFGYPEIESVDVERVTESSVWIDGRRCNIEGKYCSYFTEFDDAKRYVVDHFLGKVTSAERRLKSCQENLRKALCVLNPDQSSSSQSE